MYDNIILCMPYTVTMSDFTLSSINNNNYNCISKDYSVLKGVQQIRMI